MFKKTIAAVAALACLGSAGLTSAATIFERTELLANTASADELLPPAIDFDVSTAGNYVLTLRDLKSPALLGSLRAIVTRDLLVVAEVEVTYPGGSPQPDPVPATDTFAATPGAYRIHVLGTARQGQAGGIFGIEVAPADGGAPIARASDVISPEPVPSSGESVLQTTFSITSPGIYQLDVTDLAFPAALAQTNVLLLLQTAGGPQIVPVTGGSFNAAAGTYDLIVIATPGADRTGLFSVRVSSGATVAYQSVNAVGDLPPPTDFNFPSAGAYDLTVTDAVFPAALTGVAVAVTQNGQVLGTRTADGTSSITAAQGSAQILALGRTTTVGAFRVRVAQGAQVAYADVHVADASADASTPAIFSFATAQAVAAGGHRLTLRDFNFPRALTTVDAAVVQGDQIISSIDEAGTLDVTLQAARVKVLVAAAPPTVSGNALFGVNLATQPAGTLVFESTQGVGGLFRPMAIQVTTSGPYDITLADLDFPATFLEGALAVTRGTTLVAQIFGADTVRGQQLTAGAYVLNFIGKPAPSVQYAAYGVKVADTPPVPTVTISANPATITSGQTTTLQWSATNATGCTAENGWTGAKGVSGSEQSVALSVNTTFAIRCTGPGGSGNASVTVTVNPPSAGRSGGGGSLDLLSFLFICMGLVARYRRSVR